MPAPYPDKQRKAREALGQLFASPSNVRVIHYSSESFDDRASGQSPRVTSIAVRRLDSGQTRSFSIHAIAEERRIPLSGIDPYYNELEKEMLERFYAYVGESKEANYLHWNMRDANYGFDALEHRLRVLSGEPWSIPEKQRYDLGRMIQEMYGNEYIGNPKLQQIALKNQMTMLGFTLGEDEAQAFTRGEFVALHKSTLRKVDLIADIAERAYRRTLKTNASWWVERGGTITALIDWAARNPVITLAIGVGGLMVGIIGIVVALIHH
jgi:hypothetical protein